MEEIKVDPNKIVQKSSSSVIKPMEDTDNNNSNSNLKVKIFVVYLVLILLGIASGYGVYAFKTNGTARLGGRDFQVVKTATEEGIKDASNFKDQAEGNLVANDGKITNEGAFILKRGDASQNVYLTSAVVDLSKYENKKVHVWGNTYKGQSAGWLMDVGLVKLVN